ncbi:MAG: 30S ribosome-binding factor RbfA [Pseudomonadota bacterium]
MARPSKSSAEAGPSQRQLRVGELIRQALSELLARGDVHDDVLAGHTITVPEVRVSPDLRNATVFVMPLGGKDVDAVIAALRRNDKFIRGAVARAVNLKYAPNLKFRMDESFDEADRITRLLDSPHVRRDTEAG